MLLRCQLSLMACFLVTSSAVAQLEVKVLGADGKAVQGATVEVQAFPGRGELAKGRTDGKGICNLKLSDMPDHVFVIVRPSAKSVHAPFAKQYDLKKVLMQNKGVIEIKLKASRV
jgi:hypothetical protein